MQLATAKQFSADIKEAADILNEKIRNAADAGVETHVNVIPVSVLGVAVFDVVEVEVTVDPTKLE